MSYQELISLWFISSCIDPGQECMLSSMTVMTSCAVVDCSIVMKGTALAQCDVGAVLHIGFVVSTMYKQIEDLSIQYFNPSSSVCYLYTATCCGGCPGTCIASFPSLLLVFQYICKIPEVVEGLGMRSDMQL